MSHKSLAFNSSFSFKSCTGLTAITIPNSVTSIGELAFAWCEILADVYCYAEDIPDTNIEAFYDSPISSSTLHVPAASIEVYKATELWSGFGTIVALTDEDDIDGIREIKDESLTPTLSEGEGEWHSLDARKLDKPQRGVNIIRYSDGTSRKVLIK